MTLVAGVDIGSVSTEAVVLDLEEIDDPATALSHNTGSIVQNQQAPAGTSNLPQTEGNPGVQPTKQAQQTIQPQSTTPAGVYRTVMRTGADQAETATTAVREILPVSHSIEDLAYTVATGYGRTAAVEAFADAEVTEITTQCTGCRALVPAVDLIVDVGGQDTKVIRPAPDGGVDDFNLNDKCASGTGRFIEVLADALSVDLDTIAAADRDHDIDLGSYCTVFAESEVISLRADGHPPEAIASAVNESFASKVAGLTRREYQRGDAVIVTGGMAHNQAFVSYLADELDADVHVPNHPQTTCALGSALVASDRFDPADGDDE